ncbi:MAG: hypothetical protein J0L55_03450 [Caulobacterales bacterium]|nr:hypothetical protein [Caulobacterales bacterium]MCA0372544.1 hypothetical protein [Pseudomonadota bacterium]
MSAEAAPQKTNKFSMKDVGTRFAAWWNGVEVSEKTDEENAHEGANLEVVEGGTSAKSDDKNEAILAATNLLWGNGRTSPLNDSIDDKLIGEIDLSKNHRVSVFGAESGARLKKIINHQEVKVTNYESNAFLKQKCLEFVNSEKRAKSVSCEDFNGSPAKLPKNKADRLLIFLRGTSAEGAQAHVFSAARNLKPNGIGYWFDFFVPQNIQIGDKYSAPEGREFISVEELSETMDAAGLKIIADEDIGADFLNGFNKNQHKIKEDWENFQAQLIKDGGIVAANFALTQIMGWRARSDALKIGQLSLRKIVFCKV